MLESKLRLPPRGVCQEHVVRSLARYWPKRWDDIKALPVVQARNREITVPLSLNSVALPEWAFDCGVNGTLLVPQETCNGTEFDQVDWWLAAFLLLECWHERIWEERHGPIHSYSLRLSGWDKRAWDRSWVNRIALFLRRWAGKEAKADPELIFGLLPQTEFLVTHDVDAVRKTVSIRMKQGAFNLFNSMRALTKRDWRDACSKAKQGVSFLIGFDDWWKLDELLDLERSSGIRSTFHFYADARPRNVRRWLFDPGYDIAEERITRFIEKLVDLGFNVGLHPGYETWEQSTAIRAQREYLARFCEKPIHDCRQHWLRFSWSTTWPAQQAAGLRSDTTLMFNDRPGFRNAAAIAWHPWKPASSEALELTARPTVLMDSHLFDYQILNSEERCSQIRFWLEECRAVRGQGALLWHPHSLADDFGWGPMFCRLIDEIRRTADVDSSTKLSSTSL